MRKTLLSPLLVLAIILLLIANFGFWLSRTLYNPQNFSNLVVQTYEQEEVRNAIAGEIVDNALQNRPIAQQVLTDPIQSAIAGILGSNTLKPIFEKLAVRFQNYLTTSNRQDVTIEIGQVTPIIKSAATAISPELGAQIPDVNQKTITVVKANSLPNINKWLKPFVTISPLAGVLSLILLVYLFFAYENKGIFLKKLGLYLLIALFLFGLLIPYARTILESNVTDQNAQIIANATYNSFTRVLTVQLLVLAVLSIFIYLAGYVLSLEKGLNIENVNIGNKRLGRRRNNGDTK